MHLENNNVCLASILNIHKNDFLLIGACKILEMSSHLYKLVASQTTSYPLHSASSRLQPAGIHTCIRKTRPNCTHTTYTLPSRDAAPPAVGTAPVWPLDGDTGRFNVTLHSHHRWRWFNNSQSRIQHFHECRWHSNNVKQRLEKRFCLGHMQIKYIK